MTYCCSDIHGEYGAFKKLLEKINFSQGDTMYILGDMVDRGDQSILLLLDLMSRPNIICLLGNHEFDMILNLKDLLNEVTEESIYDFENSYGESAIMGLLVWIINGGEKTIDDFSKLSKEEREYVYAFICDMEMFAEVSVGECEYVLMHTPPSNFSENRPLDTYGLEELFGEERADYSKTYFKDKFLVTGHTPTKDIAENEGSEKIYRGNNHIAIDCGCCFGGYLAAFCLETGEEFYVKKE